MNGTKSIFGSVTFYGALVALVAGGLGLLGYHLTDTDQATIVQWLAGVGPLVGGIVAIYGRLTASKQTSISGIM